MFALFHLTMPSVTTVALTKNPSIHFLNHLSNKGLPIAAAIKCRVCFDRQSITGLTHVD